MKKTKDGEIWIFTEKGLFLRSKEIAKRYKYDDDKILEYYRSDEAVQDLQALIEKNIQAGDVTYSN